MELHGTLIKGCMARVFKKENIWGSLMPCWHDKKSWRHFIYRLLLWNNKSFQSWTVLLKYLCAAKNLIHMAWKHPGISKRMSMPRHVLLICFCTGIHIWVYFRTAGHVFYCVGECLSPPNISSCAFLGPVCWSYSWIIFQESGHRNRNGAVMSCRPVVKKKNMH